MDQRSAANLQSAAPAGSRHRMLNAFALIVPLAIHVAGSVWIALAVPFPSAIDEREHLSYIRAMESEPRLFPDHARMRVLAPDLTTFAAEENYLNHPSPYYIAMAALDRPALGAAASVTRLRLINAALSSVAVAIILLAGAAALPDIASRLVFGLAVIFFPKLAVLGGLINNDNLGLLASAITFAGLLRLLHTGKASAAIMVGLGLALGGWTKLTVAVMLGFAAVFCIILGLRRGELKFARPLWLAGAIASLGAIPTLYNLATLGRPLFVSAIHNAVPAGERPALSFIDYLGLFIRQLALKWPAFEVGSTVQTLTPLLVLILAVLGATRPAAWTKTGSASTRAVALGFVCALGPALLVHAFYGYQAFKAIGDLTSAQTRYYYPLWPGLALAMALVFAQTPAGRLRIYAAALVLLLLAMSTVFLPGLAALARGGV